LPYKEISFNYPKMLTLKPTGGVMRKLNALIITIIFILAASTGWTDIPHLINYQGMLTDNAGNPITEPRDLTFTIYDAPTSGTALWTETHTAVSIVDGLFNVILGGDTTPIPDSVFDSPERYLGIKVETDPELVPRIQLTSVGYAYRAMTSGTAETDGDWDIDGNDMYSAVSGMVGIGTVTPPTTNTMLHVDATAHMDPTVGILVEGIYPWAGYFSGNVYADTIAIGTHDPEDKLHISGGNIRIDYLGGIKMYQQNGYFSSIGALDNDLQFCNFATGRIYFATNTILSTAISRLTINNDGKIGIGTTSPDRILHIVGDNPRILIEAETSNPEVNFMSTGDPSSEVWALYKDTVSNDFRFYQNGDKVTIENSTGNVGIGTADPTDKLDINSNGIRIRNSRTPASASADGYTGEIAWDASHIYICISGDGPGGTTDTWMRTDLTTW
jgi:hypothetical protein